MLEMVNDLEIYTRRKYLEIRGIPISTNQFIKEENTDNIVIKAAELISVEIKRKYLSELSGFGAVKCRKDEIKRYLNYCYNPGRELCGQDKLLAIF